MTSIIVQDWNQTKRDALSNPKGPNGNGFIYLSDWICRGATISYTKLPHAMPPAQFPAENRGPELQNGVENRKIFIPGKLSRTVPVAMAAFPTSYINNGINPMWNISFFTMRPYGNCIVLLCMLRNGLCWNRANFSICERDFRLMIAKYALFLFVVLSFEISGCLILDFVLWLRYYITTYH